VTVVAVLLHLFFSIPADFLYVRVDRLGVRVFVQVAAEIGETP
jgi:hypothetical protein